MSNSILTIDNLVPNQRHMPKFLSKIKLETKGTLETDRYLDGDNNLFQDWRQNGSNSVRSVSETDSVVI
jgi:hypothetical protein